MNKLLKSDFDQRQRAWKLRINCKKNTIRNIFQNARKRKMPIDDFEYLDYFNNT